MLQTMMEQLDAAVYRHGPSNAAQNAKLWDLYAKEHANKPKWLKDMAAAVGQDISALPQIGCEWSDEGSLQAVLNDWVAPHLPSQGGVAEIACGGGRIASFIAASLLQAPAGAAAPPRFVCSDVSAAMLGAAQQAVQTATQQLHAPEAAVQFCHTPSGSGEEWAKCIQSALGGTPPAPLCLVVCFDAMVHMELHVQRSYIAAIAQQLAPGGMCLLSTADMTSPLGWRRFQAQSRGTVAGFVWSSPDATRHMLQQAGLRIVKESSCAGQQRALTGNLYLDRDYVVLAQKPS